MFLHDLVVKKIGDRQFMLASYWDAGYVQLDVSDPKGITYPSDSDFAALDPEAAESGLSVPPEGNAHQGEFSADDQYVLAADEDFSPIAVDALNTTDGTVISASQGSDTTPLETGQTNTGESRFVGLACDATVPAGDGTQIAVVERGVCDFTAEVANVIAAGGDDGILVFNRAASDGCSSALSMSADGDIPTFGVAPRKQGYALFGKEGEYDDAECEAGNGTQLAPIAVGTEGDTVTFKAYFDGWGYMHLYDRKTMTELDTYAIDEAHDPSKAEDFGDLSVHEVSTSLMDPSVAYVSCYAGGLRVIDVENEEIGEKAAHIDRGGNNFWGVEAFEVGGKEYIAASDRDLGLYLYEYTPVNAP